ncbi:MAG: Rrf2 family transcriptional regulator [Calditrichaceae bacterium]|nr:Rrf2 family transcriptional regulator [Calditrichaceae bacterium]
MSASTKLSTAVKALCLIAEDNNSPKTSTVISTRTGVNASKLRMLLSMLAKSGIVNSGKGSKGGFILNKDPKDIHLQEIYCSIEDRKAFHLDVQKFLGHHLSIPVQINNYFLDLFAEIQVDIEDKMKKISLQSIIDKLEK